MYRRAHKSNRMNLPPDVANEVLHSSTEAIVVVNDDGLIEFVNQQAQLLFGYDADEMIGKKVEMLMPDAMRDGHKKHRKRFAKAPRARPLVAGLNLQGQRKNGETFDAEIALTPMETEQGMLVSSAIRDISEKQTSEPFFRNLLETATDLLSPSVLPSSAKLISGNLNIGPAHCNVAVSAACELLLSLAACTFSG